MDKKIIALATAAALALPFSAVQASSVTASGFVDSTYVITDDAADPVPPSTAKNQNQNKFSVDGEVDVVATEGAVTGRIDIDVTNTTSSFEQAFFSWAANDQFTLNGGVMNTPMGLEAVDVPNINHIDQGQIFDLFEDNIAGVTGDFNLGMGSVTVGILNDTNGTAETNSFIIAGGLTVMDGLDVNGAFRSADDKGSTNTANSAPGNAWDINATYGMDMFSVSAEIFGVDGINTGTTGTANNADTAWAVSGTYAFNEMFSVAARYDSVSYNPTGVQDTTSFTLTGAYEAAENLEFLAEFRSDDDGTNSDSLIRLKAIVTLGDFE